MSKSNLYSFIYTYTSQYKIGFVWPYHLIQSIVRSLYVYGTNIDDLFYWFLNEWFGMIRFFFVYLVFALFSFTNTGSCTCWLSFQLLQLWFIYFWCYNAFHFTFWISCTLLVQRECFLIFWMYRNSRNIQSSFSVSTWRDSHRFIAFNASVTKHNC